MNTHAAAHPPATAAPPAPQIQANQSPLIIDQKWLDERHAGLSGRITSLENDCFKKENISHYVSYRAFSAMIAAIIVTLSAAYIFVGNLLIDSKISTFSGKLDTILKIITHK